MSYHDSYQSHSYLFNDKSEGYSNYQNFNGFHDKYHPSSSHCIQNCYNTESGLSTIMCLETCPSAPQPGCVEGCKESGNPERFCVAECKF
jgi:hypothetical protein